jgi:tRNA 5-methylaminomethyl-2-thiouridine biosynthesis bifunctional protein
LFVKVSINRNILSYQDAKRQLNRGWFADIVIKKLAQEPIHTITPANIYINENNTPTSQDYEDIYFCATNGAQETDYVFINGNDILNRWQEHKAAFFCIAETGFGTGLNFFRTAQHFAYFRRKNPSHPLAKLIFISTEKHPLSIKDAANIMAQWHQESFLAIAPNDIMHHIDHTERWLSQYPIPVEGIHRRNFSLSSAFGKGEIVLDLHYGDATNSFSKIQKTPFGLVDAWFLDGFAPSKNNSMWTQALYDHIASLSKSECTFATFSAAGAVKRGLQSAGFEVRKQKGFGPKREMLVGTFTTNPQTMPSSEQDAVLDKQRPLIDKYQAPYFARGGLSSLDSGEQITIVGNGLAGALTALKLTQRGKPVHLLWQGELPSDFASGNPIGGFYPQLNAQQNAASQIQLHSFLYACEFYKTLHTAQPFSHAWCGALQVAFNDNTQERLHKLARARLWPKEVAHIVNPMQATKIAGIDMPYSCLYMPNAGWIKPPSLVKACLDLAQASGLLKLQNNTQLIEYKSINNEGIQLMLKTNKQILKHTHTTKALILAMGSGSEAITKHVIPLRLTRGQVEMVSTKHPMTSNPVLPQLHTLLCHKGYFTPAVDGFHALGSSYIKNDTQSDVRVHETDANFAMHTQSMQQASWQTELQHARLNPNNYARAAVRCSSPDHLPIVGAMPSTAQFKELADLYKALPLRHYPAPSNEKNVFILTGLGSRGLTTGPLMAEILVSQILGEPMPLTSPLLDAINPNRFIVRSLIRREPWPL